MNDETVYGKVSYRLPFSAAVAAGIIVPYKVIISVSLNKEVDAELLRRGSTRVRRDELNAKWVANQIALKRAIEKTGASKIITFHSRVNLAEEFAGDSARGFQEHVKGFDVFHVNGGQNAADRKALLEDFKASPRGLITNARCLTEGVDVPAVDMVAFVDPRKSKIDIAQAAGRAMRQSKATNKKLGYIVVPLFIEQKRGETEDEALARSGFEEVAMVLGAMLENDDDLVDTIEKMQEARGRGDKFNPRQLHEKIEVIGPTINLDKLTQSIDVEILNRLGVSWDIYYGRLQEFQKREGHCLVPQRHIEDGQILGVWINNQRRRKGLLSPIQLERLKNIGFCWDPLSEQWEQGFDALKKYHKREGHSRVPIRTLKNGFNLGAWVSHQRQLMNKGRLSKDRSERLGTLDFIWDPFTEQWENGLDALRRFYKRESHCLVPTTHKEGVIKLGIWVSTQRAKKHRLLKNQIERLDSLGFCWDLRAGQFEQGIANLRSFSNREGHCRVPVNHTEADFPLGSWARKRRQKKKLLTPGQVKLLDSLGFEWDPFSEQWEQGYETLKKFYRREGNSRVPIGHFEDSTNLGNWVRVQRSKKNGVRNNQLTDDQVNRLEALDFCWDPRQEQWEQGFDALNSFYERERHCLIPAAHSEGGYALDRWVNRQRTGRNSLSSERIRKLNSLGFVWKA